MKKIIAIVFVIAMSISMASCNFSNSKLILNEDILKRDKAKFDNSFNYIAYSGGYGFYPNTKEHFEWCAKQGIFTALKGDIQLTSDNAIIMCHDKGFSISHTSVNGDIFTVGETLGLTVNSDGYIVDAAGNIYNGVANDNGDIYEAYLTGYGVGGYYKVSFDSEEYTLTKETIDVVNGTQIEGAFTTNGYQVFSTTVDGETIYYANVYTYTFGIDELCKDQCLVLNHKTPSNGRYLKVTDIDTYLFICKKYGMIPYITIRDTHIEDTVNILLEKLGKYNLRERTIINSFTYKTLQTIRNKDATITLSHVRYSITPITKAAIDKAAALGNCMVCGFDFPNMGGIDRLSEEVMAYAREKDIRIYEAQVSMDDVDELIKLGVAGAQIRSLGTQAIE